MYDCSKIPKPRKLGSVVHDLEATVRRLTVKVENLEEEVMLEKEATFDSNQETEKRELCWRRDYQTTSELIAGLPRHGYQTVSELIEGLPRRDRI